MADTLGIAMNLEAVAVTQYDGFDFNSLCVFNGVTLGANSSGIFTLEDGDDDAGTDIDAFFETGLFDFGLTRQKRVRALFIGYEADGDVLFTLENDEGNSREYTLEAISESNLQHGNKLAIGRDGKGRYWGFRVDNVDGSDFSLDHVEADIIVLGSKPGGSTL